MVSAVEAVETICSSIDLLLIALDKLTRWVKETYVYYPETANRLLGEIVFLDDILTRIKNNAGKIKQEIPGPDFKNKNKKTPKQP